MFANLTHSDWNEVLAPKVQGTWNLHKAFAGQSLDFFVLFSSLSGLVGPRGQANYAAANTFLDAFAQFRQSQGLPASVLEIGAMADVGIISENEKLQHQFLFAGVNLMHEQELLDAIELAIKISDHSNVDITDMVAKGYVNARQLGTGMSTSLPLGSSQSIVPWKRDPRMAVYRNLEKELFATDAFRHDEDDRGLRKFLETVKSEPRSLQKEESIMKLTHFIGSTLSDFMLRPVEDLDLAAPLSTFGIDSLVAIELHNWCRQMLGIRLSVLEIMGAESVGKIGKAVAQEMLAKLDSGPHDSQTS